MDREPVAFRILEARRNLVEVRGLVGGDDSFLLRLDAEGDAQVGNVGDRARLLGDELRERLAAVLVVLRDRDPGLLLDFAKLRAPVGPFGRAVVANGVLGQRRAAESEREGGRGEAAGDVRVVFSSERKSDCKGSDP